MSNYFLIGFLFIVQLLTAQTTKHTYDLKIVGISVGQLHAIKEVQGNCITYILNSEATVNFMGTHTMKTHLEVIYEHGVLLSSHNRYWKNGVLKEESSVEKSGSQYKTKTVNGNDIIEKAINYSSAMLYFERPINRKEVFFEPDAEFRTVEVPSVNEYELIKKDQATNVYQYSSTGKLEEAIFDGGLFDVTISKVIK